MVREDSRGQLTLTVLVETRKYDDYWVTVVKGLPIAAHGDSEEDADRRASDMLEAFLAYKDRQGELRTYLDSRSVRYSEGDGRTHSYERRVSVPVAQ